jgi:hypothetical protein
VWFEFRGGKMVGREQDYWFRNPARLLGEMERWRVETKGPDINAHDFFPYY